MKQIFYKSFIVLSMITFSFSACKKDKQSPVVDEDFISTEESAQADETFSDTFTDVSNFSSENDALFSANNITSQPIGLTPLAATDDPIVTVVPRGSTWPKTVTFDFGEGITKNGFTRMGKIKAVYSNRFKTKGAVIKVTFEDYYVNNHRIEGTKTITNNGTNGAGNYTFTVVVSKGRIIGPNGSFSYDAAHTIEWTKGINTKSRSDDEFSITGSSSGTSKKGMYYTSKITKPLIKKTAYPFIVSGTVEITSGDKLKKLDFGTGTLDSKATIRINGIIREIFLRK